MALMGIPDGKRQHGRPRSGNEDSSKIDINEILWAGVNWICVV
jgi:hypothetical protein